MEIKLTPITDKATSAASLATGVGVGVWGLTVNEWVAIGGFGLALITVIINAVYKHLHYRLERDRDKK